jgi:hypothetical protein
VHRNKFLHNKTNRCINFPNLLWLKNEPLDVSGSSFRRAVPCSKAVFKPVWHIPVPNVQWMNSWWWAEELPETCRFSCWSKFWKLVHLVGFIIKKFVAMHGHMNVKLDHEHFLKKKVTFWLINDIYMFHTCFHMHLLRKLTAFCSHFLCAYVWMSRAVHLDIHLRYPYKVYNHSCVNKYCGIFHFQLPGSFISENWLTGDTYLKILCRKKRYTC